MMFKYNIDKVTNEIFWQEIKLKEVQLLAEPKI